MQFSIKWRRVDFAVFMSDSNLDELAQNGLGRGGGLERVGDGLGAATGLCAYPH